MTDAVPTDPTRRPADVLAELGLIDDDGAAADPALERELARLCREAADAAGMAWGTVNLLDGSRQCQLGASGFEGGVSAQEDSVCAQLTGAVPDVYAFADLTRETGFLGNPWVDGRHGSVRGYASAPLVVDATVVGTLCVFDDEPRELSLQQCDRLAELADRAAGVLARAR